jgi:RimJ/RimL family protein N-acetyltransferase
VTTNSVALRLYERLGFKPYGIESKALRIDGAFFDEALLALDFSEAEPG